MSYSLWTPDEVSNILRGVLAAHLETAGGGDAQFSAGFQAAVRSAAMAFGVLQAKPREVPTGGYGYGGDAAPKTPTTMSATMCARWGRQR
jgi:hypothetical protein